MEKTYAGVPEEHFLNALWITWDRVRADVPGIVGAPWNVIGDEVFTALPVQDPEMAELFNRLSMDEQDELLKKAFGGRGPHPAQVRESFLAEGEMLTIISNPHEDLDVFNRIANYALTNDIAGAMADPEVNTKELYWELDEMRPWVDRVGGKEQWMDDAVVVPDNWDADAVYDFMGDLENAWHQDQEQKDKAAIAADPDKDWLEFIGNQFTSIITPDDLETLGWKEYKRYIRLSPPNSISHAMGEIHITNDDIASYAPGAREDFVAFLEERGGQALKKRKIYRSPPPIYDQDLK